MTKKARHAILTVLFIAAQTCLFAQQNESDTLKINDLQPVTVTAYRLETSDLAAPISMSVISKSQLQNGTQAMALDESLLSVPGLLVQNGSNFAQDIKVSIRGFGARSAFGIRGVKIILDGFPETAPDGTSQVDAIDPTALTSVSVVRSGTGGLYGNASGGYINFNSLDFSEKTHGELRGLFGGFGTFGVNGKIAGGSEHFQYSFNSSYLESDGYRKHSGFKNILVNGGVLVPIDSSLSLKLVATYVNSPEAQDPGALTESDVDGSRKKADGTNVAQNVGEELWQGRVGISINKKFSPHHRINANFFQTNRSFTALLRTDYVELERNYTGGNFNHTFESQNERIHYTLNTGIDISSQFDDRKRFDNDEGEREGIFENQLEAFSSTGIYAVQSFEIGKLNIVPSLRLDRINMEVKDRFLDDMTDDSFSETYNAFNPSLGISYMPLKWLNLYVNGSRNFETPTLLEATVSDGLKPQVSKTLEIGMKWLTANGKLRIELAAYRIWLNKEFISYNSDSAPSYYVNAGKSKRNGIELGIRSQINQFLSIDFNTTISQNKFIDFKELRGNLYNDYSGKTTPGLPGKTAYLAFNIDFKKSFYASLGSQYTSSLFIGNDNEVKTEPYLYGFFRLGAQIQEGPIKIGPFFGINNLFNAKYYSNIRINSFRTYEPAAPINFYLGMKFSF